MHCICIIIVMQREASNLSNDWNLTTVNAFINACIIHASKFAEFYFLVGLENDHYYCVGGKMVWSDKEVECVCMHWMCIVCTRCTRTEANQISKTLTTINLMQALGAYVQCVANNNHYNDDNLNGKLMKPSIHVCTDSWCLYVLIQIKLLFRGVTIQNTVPLQLRMRVCSCVCVCRLSRLHHAAAAASFVLSFSPSIL